MFWIFAFIAAVLCLGTVIEIVMMLFPSGKTCCCGRDWVRSAMDDHR